MATAPKSSEYKCPKCGAALTKAGDLNIGEMIGMWSVLSPEMLKDVEVLCWKCGNRTTAANLVTAASAPPVEPSECPVCGDFLGRPWVKEVKYTCPFCERTVMVREGDFPRGGGVNVMCNSCSKTLHLPARIWCPQCKKGLVGSEQILRYIAEENSVSIEQLKREGKPPEITAADLLRINEQISGLNLFGASPSKSAPADRPPAAPKDMPVVPAPSVPKETPAIVPSKYKPCPKCGSFGVDDIRKVNYTWWGGFLGPLLFHRVKCKRCGTTYNGKTGA
jgi:hypothetical protein